MTRSSRSVRNPALRAVSAFAPLLAYASFGSGEAHAATGVGALVTGIASDSCNLGQTLLSALWGDIVVVSTPSALPACGSSILLDLGFLAILVLAVIAVVRIRHHTERGRLELARRYIEQGIEPPESLFPSAARADLRRGIVLIAAGLGMVAASALMGQSTHSSSSLSNFGPAGLIPGFVGLGYLVSFAVSKFTARGK